MQPLILLVTVAASSRSARGRPPAVKKIPLSVSVRYHVSNYQPSPMVRMMKADAAPVSAQETYEQPTIQFDDQVDVVFQLEPAQGQQQDTAAKAQ
jgi:hypothetical protein